jgi:hypothetical protein
MTLLFSFFDVISEVMKENQINKKEMSIMIQSKVDEAISKISDLYFKELVSINEACKYLDVTKQCLHNWKSQGLVTPKYLGSKPYYSRRDLDNARSNPFKNSGTTKLSA